MLKQNQRAAEVFYGEAASLTSPQHMVNFMVMVFHALSIAAQVSGSSITRKGPHNLWILSRGQGPILTLFLSCCAQTGDVEEEIEGDGKKGGKKGGKGKKRKGGKREASEEEEEEMEEEEGVRGNSEMLELVPGLLAVMSSVMSRYTQHPRL